MSSILAVIPARGGSKGLPGKNTRLLAGAPLIAWSIQAALNARTLFSAIVVSTDSDEIADMAVKAGATVPFRRPAALAGDNATTLSVLQHAVLEMEPELSHTFDWVLTLQPTSPLRTAADIDAVVDLAEKNMGNCDSVVSVTERPGEHPRLAKYSQNGFLRPFLGETLEGVRRQDCRPPALFNNGALYLTRRSVLMDNSAILGERAIPYEMPANRSVDIDTLMDFRLAELLLKEARA